MEGLKALFNSEKALAGFALIIAATVLTAIGKLEVDAWVNYTKWIFAFYVAGKTVQGAVSTMYAPVETEPMQAKVDAGKQPIDHAVASGLLKPQDVPEAEAAMKGTPL